MVWEGGQRKKSLNTHDADFVSEKGVAELFRINK